MFWLGRSKVRQSVSKLGLALVLGFHLLGSAPAAARTEVPAESMATVALATLPSQARETRRLISTGGPFPYEKDGTVFRNRERLLPAEARGFYREYTVKTPGLKVVYPSNPYDGYSYTPILDTTFTNGTHMCL